MMIYTSFSAWISHFLACMGGCFGCCSKSHPIIAVDEPSKGLRIQGKLVRKPSISDDFWSTSTCEMENSTVQSQRSMSSISISNSLTQHGGTGSGSNNNEFVNQGYLLWSQSRLQWLASKKPENRRVEEPMLNWNVSYESLFGTNKRFPQPIPLSDMVDFLADIWEHEGLYD
ncbi:PREDICTED: uncharacterized protein LOC109234242 isoform X1 [Nicotiana attenuata]|uniref:Gag1-like clamp domain-containing protein n=2 Tax=Nicotiana attenuata TaxID=49451 RepID=A0A1J6HVL4_NICAT|nr:PREDICTED: uncharacterized protein LOC109234242 isoform X1 [Nicotiana attenuata]OIS96869.1 hypothetical protein A4A49_22698 [Nicotiana attenuata]